MIENKTPAQLKAWAREHCGLAKAVCMARAFAELERERVDAYIRPIFDRYEFLDGSGEPITDPDRLFLSENEAKTAEYYAECGSRSRSQEKEKAIMSNYVYQDLGVGGWTDAVKTIGKGAFDVIQAHGAAKGKAEAYKEALAAQQAARAPAPGMPKWLLPVGIGAAALVLVMILKK